MKLFILDLKVNFFNFISASIACGT